MYVLHLTTLNIYSFFLAVSSLDLAACVAVIVHVLFSLNTVNSNVPSIELSLHTVRVFGSSQYIVRNNYMGKCYILRLLTAWIVANATIMLNCLFMPVGQYRQAVTEIYKEASFRKYDVVLYFMVYFMEV